MKTRVAVDVDQVLAMSFDRVVDLMNAEFETSISPVQVNTWDIAQFWTGFCNADRATVAEAFDDFFHDEEVLRTAAVCLPMVGVMRRLAGWSSDPNGPTVITSRPAHLNELTKQWLNQYGLPFNKVVHTHEKAEYCREHKIRYLIDDAPHHALSCHRVGVGVFLIDYPWNRDVEATGANGIWRITNPVQIPDLLWADLTASSK